MKNHKINTCQYQQTYLSKSKGRLEVCFSGIIHKILKIDEMVVLKNCKKIKAIHPLGIVWLHNEHGYVFAGAFCFRFLYEDLVKLLN